MDGSRPMSARRLAALALVMVATVTVVAAVGGCASSHPPQPTASPGTAPGAAARRALARSVLAQDAGTPRWSWQVGRAEVELVARCMKARGFDYPVPPADPEPDAATTTVDALGGASYGVFPQHGPPGSTGTGQPSFELALDGAPTAAAAMTLPDGSTITYQTGGCTGATRAALFGSVRTYVASAYLPNAVRDQFGAFLATDGRYAGALTAWRSCMKDRHWNFTGPAAAISSLQAARLDAAALSRRQAAVAGADLYCDARSQLRARRGAALARFVPRLSGQLLAELDEIGTGREHAAQLARQALS